MASPPCGRGPHPVSDPFSQACSGPGGRFLTCYSPFRHFTRGRSRFLVRLACLIHAASVHSEPGSNSPSLKSLTAPSRGAAFSLFLWSTLKQGGRRNLFRRLTLHIEPPPPRRGHRISAMRSVCLPPRGPPRGAHSHCAVRFPRSSTPSSGDGSLICHAFSVSQVGWSFFLVF